VFGEDEGDAGSLAWPERATTFASRVLAGADAGVEGRDAGRDAGVERTSARRFGELTIRVAGLSAGADGSTAGVSGLAGSGEITPSDSVTAFAGDAGDAGDSGDPSDAGERSAASLAMLFCRTARYEPPAAAVRHPTANAAKTSLLNAIAIELLGPDGSKACP
jgi:hypothetical protein